MLCAHSNLGTCANRFLSGTTSLRRGAPPSPNDTEGYEKQRSRLQQISEIQGERTGKQVDQESKASRDLEGRGNAEDQLSLLQRRRESLRRSPVLLLPLERSLSKV